MSSFLSNPSLSILGNAFNFYSAIKLLTTIAVEMIGRCELSKLMNDMAAIREKVPYAL
jgi:hypothetical protein